MQGPQHQFPTTDPLSYRHAGVSIQAGESFVQGLQRKVKSLPQEKVYSGIGGFCALYENTPGRYLAVATDGVGTKIKVAQHLQRYQTLGYDLVAMNVNDLICCGARPLFFLDYLATDHLELTVAESLMEGLVEALRLCQIPLIGGETAEMPDVYPRGEWDIAGFCVGEIARADLIDGQNIEPADVLLALGSSGFHSNGYSLLRKLVAPHETHLWEELLTPTTIYEPSLRRFFQAHPHLIKGLSHITGGGVRNIPRMNPLMNFHLTTLPSWEDLPSPFQAMRSRLESLPLSELYQTFNMGMGMVMAVREADVPLVRQFFHQEKIPCFPVGKVTGRQNEVSEGPNLKVNFQQETWEAQCD